jgi:hypothetical protein
MCHDFQLEPRNIGRRSTRLGCHRFGYHSASVDMLPTGPA